MVLGIRWMRLAIDLKIGHLGNQNRWSCASVPDHEGRRPSGAKFECP